MSVNQEAADLLERAADGFESGRYYWTRGEYARSVFGNQAYCSLGALAHEAGLSVRQMKEESFLRHDSLTAAVNSLAAVVRPGARAPGAAIAYWNDGGARHLGNVAANKSDVVEAMKRAAKDLRNTEGEAA
jgi:hypothetical protein